MSARAFSTTKNPKPRHIYYFTMDAIVLHHTWNVYPFMGSLFLKGNIDSASIKKHEKDIARQIQRDQRRRTQKQVFNTGANEFTAGADCYATIEVVEADSARSYSSIELSEDGRRRKRPRSQPADNGFSMAEMRILLVKVYLAEAWSSEVVFLLDNETDQPSMCLVRGSHSFHSVLRWMGQLCKCDIALHARPWQPSSEELRDMTLHWLVHQQTEARNGQSNSKSKLALSLTFETPPEVTKIDQLSLSVPPVALDKLCREVLSTGKKNDHSGLVIWKSLKLFLLESFGIDVSAFPLVKAASGMATLSLDGRVKPVSEASQVFGEILVMLRQHETDANTSKMLDDHTDESEEECSTVVEK